MVKSPSMSRNEAMSIVIDAVIDVVGSSGIDRTKIKLSHILENLGFDNDECRALATHIGIKVDGFQQNVALSSYGPKATIRDIINLVLEVSRNSGAELTSRGR